MHSHKYRKLVQLAKESCAYRGHDIPRVFALRWQSGEGTRGAAKCRRCPAYVQVVERPAPNEVEIGGPAVAMSCPTDARWC